MSIATTIIYTVAPKGLALVRDFIVVQTMGLSKEAALIMSMIYVTQYMGAIIANGFTAEATAKRKYRNKSLINAWIVLSVIFSIILIPPYLSRLLSENYLAARYLMIFIVACSVLQTYIAIASSYFVVNTNGKQSIYLLDAIPSIAVIFATYISPGNLFNFSLMLTVGLFFSALIYNLNIKKLTKEFSVSGNDTKSSFLKIARICAFGGLMSIVNIIDIQLLGDKSMEQLAAFNLIQRYTVILASVISLIAIRHFANKIDGKSLLNLKYEKITHAIYILICSIIYYFMVSSSDLNSYSPSALALLQIPSYILLTLNISLNGYSLKFVRKVKAALIAILSKYIVIYMFGLSLEVIFISHFVFNVIAYQMLKHEK